MRRAKNTTKTFPAAYARVSTDNQSNSIESQLATLTTYFKDHYGVELVRDVNLFVDEDASAKDMDRPAMTKVLELITARHINALVATKLDRVTRSALDGLNLGQQCQTCGVELVVLDGSIDLSTPASRAMFTMRLGFAQFEREMIASRVKDGMNRLKTKQLSTGSNPYGWKTATAADGEKRHNVELVRDEHEQEILSRMQSLRVSGLSFQRIADTLNQAGYVTRKGTAWKLQYVDSILRHAAPLGLAA